MDDRAKAADHGGNLAEACARFGGRIEEWLDLSTGINPIAYPVSQISNAAWSRLPDRDQSEVFTAAARRAYDVAPGAHVLAGPGASAFIRLLPRLCRPGRVAISIPSYNEHARAFAAEGWEVSDRPKPETTAMVVVNPNNPDGRCWEVEELLLLAQAVELLVVDESFMDLTPDRSLAAHAGRQGLVVLRSFGKFYGLAGLRLGAAIGHGDDLTRLAELLGPWPVSGPALEIGACALGDGAWADETRDRLKRDAVRLIQLATHAGWSPVGGAGLFQTFDVGDATAWQERLAARLIWSRVFPYTDRWLRLGLPGSESDWKRLEQVMEG